MRYKIGQHVEIQGIEGIVRRQIKPIAADTVRNNPAFDPNFESEQGRYNGPLWHPINENERPPATRDTSTKANYEEK